MCTHGRVVFSCAHERWGLCVKQCQIAQDFCERKEEFDCMYKRPHVPTSRRLERKCNECIVMDDKLARAKKLVGRIRWILEITEEEKIVDGEENGFAKENVVESEEESLVSKPETDIISEETGESEEGDGLK
ncbi:Ff.00g096540.m01.CDS01 [Fusarium sp. VM40]|nr:Ff.00g096540.m01.CDS01 [Fusarium sp. VM40]